MNKPNTQLNDPLLDNSAVMTSVNDQTMIPEL
jgi:hypothetical protein